MPSVVGVIKLGVYAAAGTAVLGPMFYTVAQGGTWAAGAGASLDLAGTALGAAGDVVHIGAEKLIP